MEIKNELNQGSAVEGRKSYYQFPNGVEAWDISRYLSFNKGTALNYICRSGRKAEESTDLHAMEIKDLNKAMDHLYDEIVNMLGGECKFVRK